MPKLEAIARQLSPWVLPSCCMALEMSQQTVVSAQHQWLGAEVACLALTCRAIHAAYARIMASVAPVPNEARISLEACVALLAAAGLWSIVAVSSSEFSHATCRSCRSVPSNPSWGRWIGSSIGTSLGIGIAAPSVSASRLSGLAPSQLWRLVRGSRTLLPCRLLWYSHCSND